MEYIFSSKDQYYKDMYEEMEQISKEAGFEHNQNWESDGETNSANKVRNYIKDFLFRYKKIETTKPVAAQVAIKSCDEKLVEAWNKIIGVVKGRDKFIKDQIEFCSQSYWGYFYKFLQYFYIPNHLSRLQEYFELNKGIYSASGYVEGLSEIFDDSRAKLTTDLGKNLNEQSLSIAKLKNLIGDIESEQKKLEDELNLINIDLEKENIVLNAIYRDEDEIKKRIEYRNNFSDKLENMDEEIKKLKPGICNSLPAKSLFVAFLEPKDSDAWIKWYDQLKNYLLKCDQLAKKLNSKSPSTTAKIMKKIDNLKTEYDGMELKSSLSRDALQMIREANSLDKTISFDERIEKNNKAFRLLQTKKILKSEEIRLYKISAEKQIKELTNESIKALSEFDAIQERYQIYTSLGHAES